MIKMLDFQPMQWCNPYKVDCFSIVESLLLKLKSLYYFISYRQQNSKEKMLKYLQRFRNIEEKRLKIWSVFLEIKVIFVNLQLSHTY